MSPHHLALYTFAMFRLPADDPRNEPFHARNDLNFAAAESADGFVARSGYDGDSGPASWDAQVFPRCWTDVNGDGWAPSTISLWRDLESAMAFAHSGVHAEAMRAAGEAFQRGGWPAYALWWVIAGHRPPWSEGVARFEHLHDAGPSAHAFSFKHAYDAQGLPAPVDRALVRRKAEANAARRAPPA